MGTACLHPVISASREMAIYPAVYIRHVFVLADPIYQPVQLLAEMPPSNISPNA